MALLDGIVVHMIPLMPLRSSEVLAVLVMAEASRRGYRVTMKTLIS